MAQRGEKGPRGAKYDELIEKSARIFAKSGFKTTTIQDIAREMNWTSAAIYYYVKSKDDILYEIWRRAGAKLQSTIEGIISQPLSVEEKIRLVFRSHVSVIVGDRPIFETLILQRSRIPQKGSQPLENDERKYLKTFSRLIGELPESRLRYAEPEVLALGALNMLNGVIRWYSSSGRLSLNQIADIYYDMFMTGILKEK